MGALVLLYKLQTLRPSDACAVLPGQRCGVEAVVLEARDRVGGRVHTCADARFGGPVDLGASIITGTATDAGKGLRADPSAIVARCGEGFAGFMIQGLGVSIHQAQSSALPSVRMLAQSM